MEMEHVALDRLIDLFKGEVEEIEPFHTRWKPLWDSIRTIGATFKETLYPSLANISIFEELICKRLFFCI